jgi:serine/threonine protein kinase
MLVEELIGQRIDGKYAIERELGRGGMGAVYLALHIGTERHVALKVIAPEFMRRQEFVERFRREARAAGRLRHPNVVDVTDFGFADTPQGNVAYLVMEYLDGCTLGEILEEEKNLPLAWSLDILEQVCSAVHEAHEQGIIHRDLKPDNIWLEPNQRGGYTVKVLDFGIAKLEEMESKKARESIESDGSGEPAAATRIFNTVDVTVADESQTATVAGNPQSQHSPGRATVVGAGDEAGTQVFESGDGLLSDSNERSDGANSENPNARAGSSHDSRRDAGAPPLDGETRILPSLSDSDATAILREADIRQNQTQALDRLKTQVLQHGTGKDSPVTAGLTRVGAVLGTPLYMSPEQCRGEKLDPRSDIYSLGVIAYQMLSGKTPFEGNYAEVLDSHKHIAPPPLVARKIPRKVKRTVMVALSKEIDERPPNAEAFASILRSYSEGIPALLKRATLIYGENLGTFIKLAFLLMAPSLLLTFTKSIIILSVGFGAIPEDAAITALMSVLVIVIGFIQIVSAGFLVGMTTFIVAQILAIPLRPINLRTVFREVRQRWKPLTWTVTKSTIIAMIGFILCVPGLFLSARYMLIAPSIMMEGLAGKDAFKRSIELVGRSFWTVFGTSLLVYIVPVLLSVVLAVAVGGVIRAFDFSDKIVDPITTVSEDLRDDQVVNISPKGIAIKDKNETDEDASRRRLRAKTFEGLFEFIWAPIVALIFSFTSVITALLYLKTRQAGGESMQDLLAKFAETEGPLTKWQQRARGRLQISRGATSKPSAG